jgi:hypothetical protein
MHSFENCEFWLKQPEETIPFPEDRGLLGATREERKSGKKVQEDRWNPRNSVMPTEAPFS